MKTLLENKKTQKREVDFEETQKRIHVTKGYWNFKKAVILSFLKDGGMMSESEEIKGMIRESQKWRERGQIRHKKRWERSVEWGGGGGRGRLVVRDVNKKSEAT